MSNSSPLHDLDLPLKAIHAHLSTLDYPSQMRAYAKLADYARRPRAFLGFPSPTSSTSIRRCLPCSASTFS